MNSTDSITITSIDSITLEVADPDAARRFYADAFGLGDVVRLRATDAPTTGFRGYTLSLVVAQPSAVQSLFDSAVAAGATVVKAAGVPSGGRRHRPGSRRGDLADRDLEQEGDRRGHPRDRNIVVLLGAEECP